ncbi:quinone oxidoreductase [Pseudooceanicola batsensis HTCC2597]|uniref:Quinone oxidoreductase n=1 Tax=Pseudooceanicola batsensis (strain ATCC BAA-863 / DSM 15984 / KCTC 12145 / HTCC2597) TaxID=252305 RepID=A3U1B8_PSEBH|nr:NAD(P)H-quinone oxidoreductase [Pseudooceanicola batsensis]EAQ02101.1 quinone oxidoreductase [Pseudooceanicola batsensis HTCC2597]
MPETMRHITIDGFGGPEVLKPVTAPRPVPAAGEVLIRVHAAGVNRPDVVQRRGAYPPPPGVTEIPGLEVAGTIEALGEGMTHLSPGEAVCALVAGGGYAEYVAVPAGQVLPLPEGFDMVQAAALPETFFTVWANVFELGGLKRGESLLVHGGSSGIGTTAIQLAVALGARVFATARSPEKVEACRALGAQVAIDYTQENFADRLLEVTEGAGIDVILDMRGGDFFPENLRALAYRGRMVSIASLAGREVTLDIALMMRKRAMITGSTLRGRPVAEKAAIARELLDQVWPLFATSPMRPQIAEVFPLARAAEAHERLETNTVVGKIVLDCLQD